MCLVKVLYSTFLAIPPLWILRTFLHSWQFRPYGFYVLFRVKPSTKLNFISAFFRIEPNQCMTVGCAL
jgi:hypothetical protein